jgi:cell division protein FtsW (lipid II flippase)
MYAAGAPSYYILVNIAALGVGSLAAWLIGSTPAHNPQVAGIITVAVAMVLLGTALLGPRVDGVSRWMQIAGISLQPSLMLVPLAVVLFAGIPDPLSSIGLLLIALALALQPDRAMAGTLTIALAVLRFYRTNTPITLSLAAASVGFAVTLLRGDDVPPAPFVEHVVQSAFAFHTLAGLATVAALVTMLLPALVGMMTQTDGSAEFAVFSATWLGVIAFALVGNYPTPMAGYGSSGIIGYCLSAALLGHRRLISSRC